MELCSTVVMYFGSYDIGYTISSLYRVCMDFNEGFTHGERERERELTKQQLSEVPVVTHCGVLLAALVASITNENSSSQFSPWLYFPFSLYTSLFMSVINTKPMNSIRSGTEWYLLCSQRLGRYLEV